MNKLPGLAQAWKQFFLWRQKAIIISIKPTQSNRKHLRALTTTNPTMMRRLATWLMAIFATGIYAKYT
jgi:hypothetical protein